MKALILIGLLCFLISQEDVENIEEVIPVDSEVQPELSKQEQGKQKSEQKESLQKIDIQIDEIEDDNGDKIFDVKIETENQDINKEDFNINVNIDTNSKDKFSGLMYFDFTYTNDAGPTFDLKRSYFSYSKKISDRMNYKMILDVGRDLSGDDTDEKLSAYLKKAQVDIKIKNNGLMSFGLIGMNMHNVQENTWGYRYISKSPIDLYGFQSTADFGLGYKHQFGKFSLSTLLTNGEGYKSLAANRFPQFSMQLLYGSPNLRSVYSGKAFNIGLSMSSEAFESEYPIDNDAGTLTDDGDGGYTDLSTEIFNGNELVLGLFSGFTLQSIMGGFEFNMLNSFDGNFSINNGADQTPFGNDDTIEYFSTYGDIKTSTLISTYFSFGITPKFNMLLRADIYDPNNAEDAIEDSQTNILLGFNFPLSESFNLAPIIRYNGREVSDNSTTDLLVNFEVKF